jgi:hypothetical protein
VPVGSGVRIEPGDKVVTDPSGTYGNLTVPTGGAHTHYAFDVTREGKAVMRIAVVDTSLKSLAASNALQNPIQEQLTWLRDVLSSRLAGERAVVVSNTPTYSYGPGGVPTRWLTPRPSRLC